jgi:hypothetical protein
MDADQFVVRLTRLGNGAGGQYEDRGAVTNGSSINGRSGFGGELSGRLMKNNGVFLEGKGGSADFVMIATQTGPDHTVAFDNSMSRNLLSFGERR